jgi:hypothetical protein
MEMKRTLNEGGQCTSFDDMGGREKNNGPHRESANEGTNDDNHSVHTESSYRITDQQVVNFFLIYEESIVRLNNFYHDRLDWARSDRADLEGVVGRCIISGDKKSKVHDGGDVTVGAHHASDSRVEVGQSFSATKLLVNRIDNFSRDIGLVLEFLALNVTAFSKIIKKFDKRTGSSLRDEKMRDLRTRYPYLYSGGELKECKNLCAEWNRQLQVILQQDPLVVGYLRGILAPTSSADGRISSHVEVRTKGATATADENPQDNCETKVDGTKTDANDTYSHGGVENENPSTERCHKAPQRKRMTEESRVLQKMIACVKEELCLQKTNSTFFDGALDNNPPPSFASSEVEIAGELGEGEFCKIFEVRRFRVPESCHVCFLHRGYKDPTPDQKIPSSVVIDTIAAQNHEGLMHLSSGKELPSAPAIQANASYLYSETSPKPVSAFSFTYDANISDYDDFEDDHEDDGYDQPARGFMKDHCLRNGEARYAIKRIRSSLVGEEEITLAAIDLAREAEFLEVLKVRR